MTATMREAWTDERLDDLNLRVDRGFELMERRFDRMEGRFGLIEGRFEQIDRRFEQIDRKFERVDEKFEALYRLIIQLGGGCLAALIGILGVLIARL